jgi:hypothetical protein
LRNARFGNPAAASDLSFKLPGSATVLLVLGSKLAVAAREGCRVTLNLGTLGAGAQPVSSFASGGGWQAGDDESFALDNIFVRATDFVAPEARAGRSPCVTASGCAELVEVTSLGLGSRKQQGLRRRPHDPAQPRAVGKPYMFCSPVPGRIA